VRVGADLVVGADGLRSTIAAVRAPLRHVGRAAAAFVGLARRRRARRVTLPAA
jgi:2-polyprenyl-6-methoxyphenol hydroxylase-like FAD-dependent oxidoreductase